MHTMALDQSALLELLDTLKAANGDDVVRRSLEAVFQALIEAEATAAIGAEPHQRAETRVAQRNGYQDRLVTTAAGDVELRIPKLRAGSFFPSLLERRRRIDQALLAVVMEAYVTGTSTRKVDNLVVAMGSDTGISKSEVSRICADLDVEVAAFRDRSLAEVAFPYVTASRNIACHGRESPRPRLLRSDREEVEPTNRRRRRVHLHNLGHSMRMACMVAESLTRTNRAAPRTITSTASASGVRVATPSTNVSAVGVATGRPALKDSA
jgi:hypothetical protein